MGVQTMTPLSRLVTFSTTPTTAASSPFFNPFLCHDNPKTNAHGILAYEATKTMSRLLSLYRSLSNEDLDDLRSWMLKSQVVRYLISFDESFLLNLVGLELLKELEYVATSVSRLSCKYSDVELARFDLVFSDLKKGYIGIERMEFSSRNIEKVVKKVEKLTTMTANLHATMSALSEMECNDPDYFVNNKVLSALALGRTALCNVTEVGKCAALLKSLIEPGSYMEAHENKIQRWKKNGGSTGNNNLMQGTNFGLFESKIAFQRKQAKRYMELSLWNVSFDK